MTGGLCEDFYPDIDFTIRATIGNVFIGAPTTLPQGHTPLHYSYTYTSVMCVGGGMSWVLRLIIYLQC